jgi:hypothetical protein
MTDWTRNYHGGDANSRAAAALLSDSALAHRAQRILYALARAGADGLTCEEIERATGISHQSAGSGVIDLLGRGLAHRTGARRPTRSGRQAWVVFAGPPPAGAPVVRRAERLGAGAGHRALLRAIGRVLAHRAQLGPAAMAALTRIIHSALAEPARCAGAAHEIGVTLAEFGVQPDGTE